MRLTQITIPWADGEYAFDLKLGNVRAVEEKTGLGLVEIYESLHSGKWKVDHIREVLLQGLLGGGFAVDGARKLILKWVDNRPAQEGLLPAQSIILAWLVGAPQGKTKTPETQSEVGLVQPASTSANSMEPELQ